MQQEEIPDLSGIQRATKSAKAKLDPESKLLVNPDAFQALISVCTRPSDIQKRLIALNAVSDLFRQCSINYFLAEGHSPIARILESMDAPKLMGRALDILEYVVVELDVIPLQELVTLSSMIEGTAAISAVLFDSRFPV